MLVLLVAGTRPQEQSELTAGRRRLALKLLVVCAACALLREVAAAVALQTGSSAAVGIGVAAQWFMLLFLVCTLAATAALLGTSDGMTASAAFSVHRVLGALRSHIVLVLLFVVVMLVVSQGREQFAEAIRTWPVRPIHAFLAIPALVLLAAVIRETTSWVLLVAPKPATTSLRAAHVVLAAAAAAVLALGIRGATGAWAWGLALGVGALALLWLLAYLGDADGPAHPMGDGVVLVPLVLAVAPLLAVSLATIHAMVPEWYVSGDASYLVAMLAALVVAFSSWWYATSNTPVVAPGAEPPAAIATAGGGEEPRSWAGRVRYVLRDALAMATTAAKRTRRSFGRGVPGRRIAFGAAFAGSLAILIAIYRDAQSAEALGTVVVLAAWTCLLATAFAGLLVASERLRTPDALRALHIGRIPFFAVLLIWAFVAFKLDPDGYHEARTIDAPPIAAEAPTLEGWFQRWLAQQEPVDDEAGRPVAPLVLVSAEGGGIRAAYWTTLAIDCIVGGGPTPEEPRAGSCPGAPVGDDARRASVARALFAGSGASGGSVGLATWTAHAVAPEQNAGGSSWVDTRLGGDFVSPVSAAYVYNDFVNAFLRRGHWEDRAAVLEESFEEAWQGASLAPAVSSALLAAGYPEASEEPNPLRAPFIGLWRLRYNVAAQACDERCAVPLLLLNATSVKDGCRVNVGPLPLAVRGEASGEAGEALRCLAIDRFADERDRQSTGERSEVLSGTTDLADLLCYRGSEARDIRLSTAAALSARFPYVSPSGRIPDHCGRAGASTTYAVDGGYLDNSGSGTIVELWRALAPLVARNNADPARPCVVPVAIHVDNHYNAAKPDDDTPPAEATVPVISALSIRDGYANAARQAEARLFSDAAATGVGATPHYFYVQPQGHAGVLAPLGWALSRAWGRICASR